MSDALTPHEAAEHLGMHRDTLLRKVRTTDADAPPAHWTGTRWRFSRAALDQWLAQRTTSRLGPAKVELPAPVKRCRRRTYPTLPQVVVDLRQST